MSSISIAEQQLNKFLPTLQDLYPEGRKSDAILKDLAAIYENIVLPDDVVVGLFDYRTASYFFLSKNIKKLIGYEREKLLKWGTLISFKAIHYTHYSHLFNEYKYKKQFRNRIPASERNQIHAYSCGLKIVGKSGQIKRTFAKTKPLLINSINNLDISIEFWEDVTPLIKGDQYWLRWVCKEQTLAYIHQQGKNEFKDLLSKRELEILQLTETTNSSMEISEQLGLSKMTVETHRKNMLKKTGASNIIALTQLCKMANIL